MKSASALELSRKLRIALELADLGTEMMRENVKRRLPGASAEEIAVALARWRNKRPGAEFGDGVGRPCLIEARGYARGRDLVGALEEYLLTKPLDPYPERAIGRERPLRPPPGSAGP